MDEQGGSTGLTGKLRAALGLALAGLCFWLIFRHLDWAELQAALRQPQPLLLALALLSLAVGYSCRIWRWRLLLLHENPALRWQDCAGPLLGSFAANNILPLRLGDVIRSVAFNRKLGISTATALTSVIVERLLDLLMLLLLFGTALLWFGMESASLPGNISGTGGILLMAAAGGVMLMLFLPSAFKPPVLWCCRYSGRLWPKFGEAAARQAEKIFAALEYAADGHIMGRLALWSALAWTAEGGVFYFVGLALPAVILAEGGWLALPMGSLATLVPAAPGYAGTFDYFVIQAMLALGESPAAATAFAFVVHGVLWLPVTLIGAGYLAMFYRR